ncbi:hypothetical protein NW752_007997 [Fusarium irregulare]|uniref:Nucleotide-diphospho-sugar transferase domain-containing protein n=1 Tax=Fusarium irregulare TaxID=2494466 RepID=A0A9W8PWH2_9HYPO|nr:hypothetical protein NW752_007997 [Fusarium irregulare]KAJ4019729.1 hypothetical protein NW766_003487 [Fusarium irregulare]
MSKSFGFPTPVMDHLFLLRANRRKGVLLAMGILVIFGLAVHSWLFYFPSTSDLAFRHKLSTPLPVTLAENTPELMHHIWKPFLHDINATNFISKEGYHYKINKKNQRWAPQKKKLLILDVDTRLDTGAGAMMNKTSMKAEEMTGRTGGMMNHYLYAMIHGYDYQFIRAPDYRNRHGTWVKVPMIKEALKTHETVVFLDADAVFMYPEIPFEWLMSLWNITDNTLIALANDPDSPRNRDNKGKVMQNTGFMVARQSNRTQELFHDWNQCPTDTKYKDCSKWAHDWAHEQAAFSNHVRYDYNRPDDVRTIPCMDGNGAPYIGDKSCGGVFIRHHWFHKDYPANDMRQMLLDTLVKRIHAGFHHAQEQNFIDATHYTHPLNNIKNM